MDELNQLEMMGRFNTSPHTLRGSRREEVLISLQKKLEPPHVGCYDSTLPENAFFRFGTDHCRKVCCSALRTFVG